MFFKAFLIGSLHGPAGVFVDQLFFAPEKLIKILLVSQQPVLDRALLFFGGLPEQISAKQHFVLSLFRNHWIPPEWPDCARSMQASMHFLNPSRMRCARIQRAFAPMPRRSDRDFRPSILWRGFSAEP